MPDPAVSARKLAAKRQNERIKLVASALNAISLGIIGAAIIVPGTTSIASLVEPSRLGWFVVAFAIHLGAQFAFSFLRSED